jgi:DNA replication and repair protein RecF
MGSYLANLRLRTFRNYPELDVAFSPGPSLLVGRNGQGKSNVLEAVCYLALLRSFRTQSTTVLRQWGADGFSVEGELGATGGDPLDRHSLKIQYGERRLLRFDGNPVDRASDFINQFHCVPLVPEDIDLVRGSARERRRFVDILCSQLHPGYVRHLQDFNEAIRARNAILRGMDGFAPNALAGYDEVVVRHGAELEVLRGKVVSWLGRELANVSERLFVETTGGVGVEYSSFCDGAGDVATVIAGYREALAKSRDRDVREGRTCVGPHLANLNIHLAGRPVARYGSEGECRLTAIALRLASLGVIRQDAIGARAVVLLVDDVFGELDTHRRAAFFSCVAEADQTLITATEQPAELPTEGLRVFHVQAGEVTLQ